MVLVIACVLLGLVVVGVGGLLLSARGKLFALKQRFAVVVNADDEAARIVDAARQRTTEAEAEAARIVGAAQQKTVGAEAEAVRILASAQSGLRRLQDENAAETRRHEALGADYAKAKSIYDQLSRDVRSLEENLEDISFGLYKPHYQFDTPEAFKRELEKVTERQKAMVRSDRAATFAVTWSVGGSEREGAKMQKQYAKVMLRAFNGECDAAVAKVAWNNASKMEERILKACEAINKLGDVMKISIATEYRDLKLAELRLEHELEEKKRAIADEQRSIREQMREEERVQRDAEKVQADAEAEETRFAKALEKARVELAKSKGEEHTRMNVKLVELEQALAEARAKSVRAKSMAELTKAGYVYVISNVGSLGENVLKIGMTRRLDPMDRVKELGDASVPFPFDVHAMVYSENAPALECTIHQHFAAQSVNLVNMRKEFFHVSLAELECFATDRDLKISFTKVAEAREYRESTEMRRARRPAEMAPRSSHFPSTLAPVEVVAAL